MYSVTFHRLYINSFAKHSSITTVSSNLVQADPESVAVKVCVLPRLSWLSGVWDARLPGGPAGRGWGGVLLITEMFVLQNVVGVLPLKISRNWRHDGSVDRRASDADADISGIILKTNNTMH